MWERLSLRQKTTLICLVPGLVQICLLIALAFLVMSEEQEALAEAQSRKILVNAYDVQNAFKDYFVAAFLIMESKGLLGRQLAGPLGDNLREQLKVLDASTANTSVRPIEEKLAKATNEVLETGDEILHQRTALMDPTVVRSDKTQLILNADAFAVGLKELLAKQGGHVDELDSERRARRMQLRFGVALAVITSLGVAGVAARLFFNTMLNSLQALSANMRMLSERKPLYRSLEGTDELAALDRTLRDIDNELNETLKEEAEMFESSAELIFALRPDFTFERLNAAVRDLLGYEPDELIGKGIAAIVSTPALLIEQLNHAKDTTGSASDLGGTLIRKDGSLIDASWSVVWSPSEQLFFCTVHDTTEQNRVIKMKARFASSLHQEIAQPLNTVSRELYSALSTPGLSTAVSEDLVAILTNVDRLIKMTDEFVDVNSFERTLPNLSISQIGAAQIANITIEAVEKLCEAKRIRIVTSGDLNATVMGDELKCTRALTNLVGNAIKFTPTGGTIEIQVAQSAGFVRFNCLDQGPGVPDEFKGPIFSPFVQVPGQAQSKLGTGLGLAICALIVRAHRGDYGIEDRPGGGSNFWFTLPTEEVTRPQIASLPSLNQLSS